MKQMPNHILVLSPGMYSSIQDKGRKKYRSYGVPVAGVMDKYSTILANKLLNNEEFTPVMEMTYTGAKLMFEDDTFFVVTGADISPLLNDQPIELNMVYPVSFGDILSFGKLNYGTRAYLAVKGGFLTEKVMGSFSYYKGITGKYKIEKGDRIEIGICKKGLKESSSKVKVTTNHFDHKQIEVTKGPEYDLLTKRQKAVLFREEFEIDGLNNRMGYQLKNKIIPFDKSEIITSALTPGTVQLTPSGKLIVMMRDCPTTGGYPRILQLTDMAINQLAQKRTGDIITFELERNYSFLRRLASVFMD